MTSRFARIVCIALAICYAHAAGAQEPGAEASLSVAQQPIRIGITATDKGGAKPGHWGGAITGQ